MDAMHEKTMPDRQGMRMRVDGYTRVCLTAITVLLTVLVLQLAAMAPSTVQSAQAATSAEKKIPASSYPVSKIQRDQLIDGQEKTNQLLTDILETLKSGQIKVIVEEADNEQQDNQ